MSVLDPPPETSDFRLIRQIGSSNAASVYAATELAGGRRLAVKIFHRVDADCLARLERQLRANAQLVHPNIVRVHGAGRTRDGRLFYATPLLAGFERMRPNLLGQPASIAMLLRDLLAGLDEAHRRGVVHSAIKPSNVLFDEHGRGQLTDFGIARCLSGAPGELANPRTDLHDIGMLAYALLADAATAAQRAAFTQSPPPRLPPAIAAWQPWLDRALAQSPEQQFPSAREMAGVLTAIMHRVPHRERGAPASQRRKRAPRWRLRTVLPIAATVVLLGSAAWDYFGEPSPVRENLPAALARAASVAPPAAGTAAPPLPIAAAPAVTTLPAAASSTQTLADRVQTLIGTADTLRAKGHLFSPPFRNAASKYLAAAMLDPGNRSAMAGIDATLAALQGQLDKSWQDGHDTSEAAGMVRQGDEFAKHAGASARRDWRKYRGRLARRVGDAAAQATRKHDARRIAALQPLAKALPAKFPAGFDPVMAAGTAHPAVADAPAADTPRKGERVRDPHGPLLVYVPAAGGRPAFAIQQVEVTRADYAAFARATYRSTARCLAAHNPFSRLRHLAWRSPGFAQGGDQPAVCVSWDDAAAYAAWLSQTTGESYRLPTSGQWQQAAQGVPKGDPCQLGNVDDSSRRGKLDDDRWPCNDGAAFTAPVGHYAPSGVGAYDLYGNVSEWVAGGSAGTRVFRGLSWRDGSSHENPLDLQGTADSDVGYTSVGFRVVRVIDVAHPAPPAASSH